MIHVNIYKYGNENLVKCRVLAITHWSLKQLLFILKLHLICKIIPFKSAVCTVLKVVYTVVYIKIRCCLYCVRQMKYTNHSPRLWLHTMRMFCDVPRSLVSKEKHIVPAEFVYLQLYTKLSHMFNLVIVILFHYEVKNILSQAIQI